MMRHTVVQASGAVSLEMRLDNLTNKGWSIISVQESPHMREAFWIVAQKKEAD